MLTFNARRYYNGTTKVVNYVGTLQPDGYVYFNDNRYFRGRYSNNTLSDIQVLYESKHQWIRAAGLIEVDSSSAAQQYNPGTQIIQGNVRQVINLAEAQIGHNGTQYWDWYRETYNRPSMGPYVDGNTTPWCAVFISWLLYHVGATSSYFPSTVAFDTRDIPTNERIAFNNLQAGDIVSFDWDGDSTGDHVGLVTGLVDGMLYTIDGNTDDNGYCQRRVRNSSTVLFGIRPQYAV